MDHRLYLGTKNASSWAMRAWLALRAAGCAFDEKVVDIRRPQRFANLAEIGRVSPPAAVPVLVAGEQIIFDSLAIMEYANDLSGGALLPSDPVLRAQARSILGWQHAGLSGICARISFESSFYPIKRRLTDAEAAECRPLLGLLEARLSESGGPFLFGIVSLADFALTPTVIRLARHRLDLRQWPRAARWRAAILDHPLVREWMEEADALPHIWYDDYLLPGAQHARAFEQA